jgi:hypothetical protein
MKIKANIKEKTWESENASPVPYTDRNSVYILLSGLSEINDDESGLNFGILVIKNGEFCKSEFFPKGLQKYDGDSLQEVVPVSINAGDKVELYAWLRTSSIFFENTFSLTIEDSPETVDNLEPDPELLAKKDYRKDSPESIKKYTDKINSDPSIDKL